MPGPSRRRRAGGLPADPASVRPVPDRPTGPLVRHGHTAYNAAAADSAERIRGWIDIPLTAQGRREAQQVAQDVCRYPVTRIITSDLQRAAYTAHQIARACQPTPTLNASRSLRPW